MDPKKIQASWEHIQAREKEFKAKEEEWKQMKAGWDSMQASSKQAQDQLAALKADLAAQIALNKKMAGQVKEKDSRIRALEAELEALRAKNGDSAALLAQLEDAKAHSAALSQQVAAESAAREAAIAESLATAQRAQLLQEQVDALNRTAAEAVKRLHENLDGAEANRMRLKDKEMTIQAKEKEIESLGANLRSAQVETSGLQAQLSDVMGEKKKAEARLAAMEAAFMRSSQEAAGLKAKQSSAAEQRQVEQNRWNAERVSLQSQLSSALAEVATLRSASQSDANRIAELTTANQASRAAWEEDRNDLRDQLDASKEEAENMRHMFEASQARLGEEARAMAATLNEHLSREEELKKEVRKWKSEAQRLAAEVERLNALLSIKDTAYGKVLGDLDAAQAAMEGVKAQIRALQETADNIPVLESQLADARAVIEAERQAKAQAMADSKSEKAHVRHLQRQFDELRRTHEAVQARLTAAENKNSDEVLEATEAAHQIIDSKNDEIRVLRMMLEASKIEARTKEREKVQLQKKLHAIKGSSP